LKTEYWF
jgi:hypothetical protein